MLVGNLTAIGCGGLFCVVVSIITNWGKTLESEKVWEGTRDIDSPLCPWTEKYAA